MTVRRLLVLSLLASSMSCGSSSESPIRSNVHEILRGGLWEDARCTEQHFEYCCLEQGLTSCTGYDSTSIVAVRHRGDRIGVLTLSNGVHLVLLQSEDRGTTWQTVSIQDDDFARGGSYYTGGLDLLLTADTTWLYAPHSEIGAGGRSYSRGYFFRIDMSTGKLTTDLKTMPGAPPIEERDGRAIFLVPDGDPFSGEISLMAHEIDPANRANDRSSLVPCNEPCSGLYSTSFLGTDDGELYYGVTNNTAPRAECTITYHRTTQTIAKVCVPYAEWPGTGEAVSVLPFAGTQGALVKAFSRGGHAWAATMIDDGNERGHSSPPVDLGPGKIFPNGSFGGWPRFRGMAIVQGLADDGTPKDNLNTRLVRVPASGPAQDVVLPITPCEDDSKCGYLEERQPEVVGQMHWIESLGNDDYLVFYRSDSAEGIAAHQQTISVALEHATYTNIDGGALPLDGAVGYADGREMAAIGAMCARATSCIYGTADAQLVCMLYWSVRNTTDAAKHHAALQAFLASPPGCSGFAANPSTGYVGGCNGLEPNCGRTGGDCDPNGGTGSGSCIYPATAPECNTCTPDGKAISCTGSTVTSVLDCAAVGQSCECSSGACACVPPPCTPSNTATCVGDVWTTCEQTRDCGLNQQTCFEGPPDPTSYFVGCTSKAGGCGGLVWCDGRFLMACVTGTPQFFDCKANGYASCGFVSGTNQPACLP